MRRLDSNTLIFLLLISRVEIELPVEVSACVETKPGAFSYILRYGLSVVFGDLFRVCQNRSRMCGALLHPLQYSLESEVGFGGQRKGSVRVLDLFKNNESSPGRGSVGNRKVGAYTREMEKSKNRRREQ